MFFQSDPFNEWTVSMDAWNNASSDVVDCNFAGWKRTIPHPNRQRNKQTRGDLTLTIAAGLEPTLAEP